MLLAGDAEAREVEYMRTTHTRGLKRTCNSRSTKLPELTFHAVVSDEAREIRFERARG